MIGGAWRRALFDLTLGGVGGAYALTGELMATRGGPDRWTQVRGVGQARYGVSR